MTLCFNLNYGETKTSAWPFRERSRVFRETVDDDDADVTWRDSAVREPTEMIEITQNE